MALVMAADSVGLRRDRANLPSSLVSFAICHCPLGRDRTVSLLSLTLCRVLPSQDLCCSLSNWSLSISGPESKPESGTIGIANGRWREHFQVQSIQHF